MTAVAASLPDRLGGAPDGKRALRLWLRGAPFHRHRDIAPMGPEVSR